MPNSYLRFLLLLLAPLFGESLHSQTRLTGQIIDQHTSKPVPWVNVGIPQAGRGTVSDEQGKFSIEVHTPEHELVISAIGYAQRKLQAKNWPRNGRVTLVPQAYALDSVTVTSRRFANQPVRYGEYNKKGRGTSLGFGSQQLGSEFGALIPLEGPTLLKKAFFVLNHAKGDSMHFRINIYAYQDGEIGENVLQENVLIREKQRKGTLAIDLAPYNIAVDGPVLLTLEWIKNDGEAGNQGLSFDVVKARHLPGTYMRMTSQAPLERVMYKKRYRPCFYVEGIPAN